VAGVLLALALASTVLGHGGQIVVVEPPVAPPGAEVSIHGDYLWTDMAVTITLVRAGTRDLPLGTAQTDGQGHLEARATLPDLRAGSYQMVVTSAGGEGVETEFVVQAADLTIPIAAVFALLIAGVFAVGAWLRRRPVAATPPDASRSPRATAARN
jgi:hypothetical protein